MPRRGSEPKDSIGSPQDQRVENLFGQIRAHGAPLPGSIFYGDYRMDGQRDLGHNIL